MTKDKRWYKDVGLGFKTPSEAINGTYIGEQNPLLYAAVDTVSYQKSASQWGGLHQDA